MKYVDYNEATGQVKGFYDKTIHGVNIPSTAIEISDDDWQLYLSNQGKYIMDVATKKLREMTDAELQAEIATLPKATPQPTVADTAKTIADLTTQLVQAGVI